MYYSVVLFVAACLTAFVAASGDECQRLMRRHHHHCCKKENEYYLQKETDMESIKECLQLRKKPPSCDVEICIAQKKGFASDDGTIDNKALEEYIEKEFESEPEIVESIKSHCLEGDLSKYGPTDFCDHMKLKYCIHVQFMKHCPEWDNEGHCKGVKELYEKCNSE